MEGEEGCQCQCNVLRLRGREGSGIRSRERMIMWGCVAE